MEGLIEKDSAKFKFIVDIELSDNLVKQVNKEINEMRRGLSDDIIIDYIKEKYLRYTLEIELLPKQGILRVWDESLQALCANSIDVKNSRTPFLQKIDNKRLSLRMEGQAHPSYFDIGLDHTVLSKKFYAPHYPHITAFIRELESWRFFYFEPRERMRASNPTKEVRHIGLMGEDLAAYLHSLKNNPEKKKHFDSICKAVKIIIPSIEGIRTAIDVKTGDIELYLIEGGRHISSRLISEGTLRLLGLLSITGDNDNPTVICFEEPENGINPRKISLIAEFLKNTAQENTQIIATTHSAILPDQIGAKSLFTCTRKNGSTVINPFRDMP